MVRSAALCSADCVRANVQGDNARGARKGKRCTALLLVTVLLLLRLVALLLRLVALLLLRLVALLLLLLVALLLLLVALLLLLLLLLLKQELQETNKERYFF